MDYTKLDLHHCFDLACTEFGLEDDHTRGIAKLLDLAKAGYLDQQEARHMAQIIYHHGCECLYYNEAWDEDEEWEEPDWGDEGFDLYTGDC